VKGGVGQSRRSFSEGGTCLAVTLAKAEPVSLKVKKTIPPLRGVGRCWLVSLKAERYYLIINCQHPSFRLWRDKYLPSRGEFTCHSRDCVSP